MTPYNPTTDKEAIHTMVSTDTAPYHDLVGANTVYASNPSVYYEPFIYDGRVGYRVQTNNAGDTRETFVYFNPSEDTSDGMPTVFVYVGGENDPNQDAAITHIALDDLQDGPLQECGHNWYQRDGGVCHGCQNGEERHVDWSER